jgi:hypothetical protein
MSRFRSAQSEVDDMARHVPVLRQVLAHCVSVCKAEAPRDVMRVDEISDVNSPTHRGETYTCQRPLPYGSQVWPSGATSSLLP